MADDTAIKIDGVSKDFKLPHEKTGKIKHAFTGIFRRSSGYEIQHALKGVSLEVKKGEFFGIVGRNGSGKSTLLKIISNIYQPTEGSVEHKGKLVPFIELGVGFNPELTGRENVYLNGALMGFSDKEIDEMYDSIVEFAELERFMDQQLKNYSSGMQVRLAFSIAVRADADILVLDEVLAVGDSNFQKKCSDYFEKIKNKKKTVILVTHNMDSVERFCDKAMLIDNGEIIDIDEPSGITQRYSDLNFGVEKTRLERQQKGGSAEGSGDISVTSAIYAGSKKSKGIDGNKDKKLRIGLDVKSKINIEKPMLGLIIFNNAGAPIFATNTRVSKTDFNVKKNKITRLEIDVDNAFSNGEYTVSVSVKSKDGSEIYYIKRDQEKFVVGGRRHDFALASPDYKIQVKDD